MRMRGQNLENPLHPPGEGESIAASHRDTGPADCVVADLGLSSGSGRIEPAVKSPCPALASASAKRNPTMILR